MELLTRLETLNGTGKFTYICVAFMLMFTAFNTAQNLIPVLFEQLGYASLGKICLFSCYGLFSFGSVLASDLVQKWGYVKSMFYCGLAYMGCFSLGTLLTACEYYETSFGYCDNTALVVASNVGIFAIGGFLSAVLWTAVSGYVAAIATDNDQKAKFYGLLFTAVNSSFVIGSIFSSILLRIWSKYAYFVLLSTLGGAATVMYYFIPFVPVKAPVEDASGKKSSVSSDAELLVGKIYHNGEPVKKFEMKPLDKENPHYNEENHNIGVNPMYQEERTERILSAPLIDNTDFGSHHEDGLKPTKSKSINDNFQVIFGLMKNRKVKPWLWVMALSGFVSAYLFTVLYQFVKLSLNEGDYPTKADMDREASGLIAQVFLFLGIGEILSGFICGPVTARYGVRKFCIAILCTIGLFLGLSIFQVVAKQYWLACIIAFFCGCSDLTIQAMISSAMATRFNGKMEYFCIFRFVQCLGSSSGMLITTILSGQPVFIIVCLLSIYWVFALRTVLDSKYI